MKFVQRSLGKAAEASNPGPTGLGREALVLIVATAVALLASYFLIGQVVELILPRISIARERSWFGRFDLAKNTTSPDGPVERERFERARAMLARLAKDPRTPDLDHRLVLIADRAPNAFALPGGAIAVTRGLLAGTDDDAALAFVLGHELGHFRGRDHLRGVGRAVGRALVWGLVFGRSDEVLSQQAGALLDLAHSRQQEAEADIFGFELARDLEGNKPNGEAIFRWLAERERQPAWTSWLQTHPDPGNRIELLRAHARATAPP